MIDTVERASWRMDLAYWDCGTLLASFLFFSWVNLQVLYVIYTQCICFAHLTKIRPFQRALVHLRLDTGIGCVGLEVSLGL